MGEAEEKRKQYEKLHEDLEKKITHAGSGTYCYPLNSMEKYSIGSHYGAGVATVIKGEKIQMVLVDKPRGTGSRLHTHPNEQWNYVLKGRLRYHVAGVEGFVNPGDILYIPANAQHWTVTTVEEDALYLAAKDTTYFSSGDPVDTSKFGGHYEPGFEPKA